MLRKGSLERKFRFPRYALLAIAIVPLCSNAQTAAERQEEKQQANKTQEKALGESKESDYTAKHFSFVVGGVAINQFATPTIPDSTDPSMIALNENGGTRFSLLSDGATTNAFIEAGFRWRWAWLDRQIASEDLSDRFESAILSADDAEKITLNSAKQSYLSAKSEIDSEIALLRAKVAATAAEISRIESLLKTSTGSDRLAEKAELQKSLQTTKSLKGKADSELAAVQVKQNAIRLDAENTLRIVERPGEFVFGLPSISASDGWRAFVPTEWSVRLGYAFGDDIERNATTIAGSSDMYLEADVGWNLARWAFPTSGTDQVPIRGSFNFEVGTSLATQADLLDIQGRHFAGFSTAIGVPIGPATAETNAPIAEVLARIGWVSAERPEYLNDFTNEIESRNGLPRYKSDSGWGLDVEMNIPVSKNLGYIMLRGKLNKGFDPNPWSITVGYTVPLQSIFDGLGKK